MKSITSTNRKVVGFSRGLRTLMVAGVLIAIAAVGCRSTPPAEEDPTPVEEPDDEQSSDDQRSDPTEEIDESESLEQDRARSEEERDERSEEQEDDVGGEKVAPHVDARIESALDDANAGDVERAVEALEGLVAEPEGGFMAAYNLGVLNDRRGEMDEAAENYAEALRRQPDFTPALTNLIRLYLRAGQISQAEEVGQHFMDERPENLNHRAAYLDVPLARGRYEDVIAGAREILRRDFEHVDAMIQLATAKYHLGRYELARAILQGRATELSPDRAEIYYLLGQIAWAFGQREVAQQQFGKAIDLQPRFPEARNNYAILLHEAGNFVRAIEHLEAALADAPQYVEAKINLGNSLKAQNKYGEAEEIYRAALEIDDQNSDAYFNLGILYLETPVPDMDDIPRYEKAIESFNEYRRLVGEREASQSPVADYINDAVANIEIEEERQEALRRAQSQQEEREAEEEEESEDNIDEEEP